jgi:hypothetical protein
MPSQSASNSLGDKSKSLQTFNLLDPNPSPLIGLVVFFFLSCATTRHPVELTESSSSKQAQTNSDVVPDSTKNFTATIFIASIPPIAKVYMDGVFIGKTNIEKLKVQPGKHHMRFVVNGDAIERDMEFEQGNNRSKLVSFK